MVKGNFQCIGTPQHIKSKYGEGMEIEIKLMPIDKSRVDEVIAKKKLQKLTMVTPGKLQEVLTILNASEEDKAEISEYGKANHIFQLLSKERKV